MTSNIQDEFKTPTNLDLEAAQDMLAQIKAASSKAPLELKENYWNQLEEIWTDQVETEKKREKNRGNHKYHPTTANALELQYDNRPMSNTWKCTIL